MSSIVVYLWQHWQIRNMWLVIFPLLVDMDNNNKTLSMLWHGVAWACWLISNGTGRGTPFYCHNHHSNNRRKTLHDRPFGSMGLTSGCCIVGNFRPPTCWPAWCGPSGGCHQSWGISHAGPCETWESGVSCTLKQAHGYCAFVFVALFVCVLCASVGFYT